MHENESVKTKRNRKENKKPKVASVRHIVNISVDWEIERTCTTFKHRETVVSEKMSFETNFGFIYSELELLYLNISYRTFGSSSARHNHFPVKLFYAVIFSTLCLCVNFSSSIFFISWKLIKEKSTSFYKKINKSFLMFLTFSIQISFNFYSTFIVKKSKMCRNKETMTQKIYFFFCFLLFLSGNSLFCFRLI